MLLVKKLCVYPAIFAAQIQLAALATEGPLLLWSTNAGVPGNNTSWIHDAYPIGNGKLAAMVYGGVATEEIQFNEDTIWIGQPHYYENPNTTPQRLAAMRDKVFSGSNIWAEAQAYLMSQPLRQASYQPAGSLILSFPHAGATNYRRTLDLETATVTVRYEHAGVTYTREVFASAPSNRVIAVRLTASQPGRIAFTCNFTTPQPSNSVYRAGSDLVLRARVSVKPRPEYFATGLTNAIEYEARVRVIAEGGTVTFGPTSVTVTNADAVTILLAVASNFVRFNDISANPSLICSNVIAAAAALPYEQLRAGQLADYQALFRRVRLELGATWKTNLPTGERAKRAHEGDDPQLVTLYFQLGRYLMIAGSRPGSQPLNLQGKWNNTTNPSWESKMTLNINQEMNYWGAEMCNLSECHEPLFDMIADLAVTGARVARTNYFCRGWVVHHNTDLWRGAAPINGADGIWPCGGAWLCQHLWWHYQYTGDTNWLASFAYPLMKSAAEFFVDFLIPHRSNTAWLVTNPSYSPEHDHPTFRVPNVAGPTIDNQLVRDLFNNVVRASEVLGVDAAFRTNLLAIRNRVPPNLIGRLGQIQEWLEDVDSPTDTHRHLSHLVALFPGDEITPFHTPAHAAAAKVSLDIRAGDNLGSTGWDKSWKMCCRTRLLDGDRAYLLLTNLFRNYVSTNLMFTDVNNRQVDAIFGALAGVTEMLLQSHRDELFLLPALPSALPTGSVTGLCARGGFEVAIQWQSNKLACASIISKLGNTCRVRSRWPIEVWDGTNRLKAQMVQPWLWEFPTERGRTYTVVPAQLVEAETLPISTSPGDTATLVTNAVYSNLRAVALGANAPGDFITFTLSNVAPGNYRVLLAADARTNCAVFQCAIGPFGGPLTELGPPHDTFSPTNFVYFLPVKLAAATNQYGLWTNFLKEFDCGIWRATSNGTYQLRLAVLDKNPASSGFNVVVDYIRLCPVLPPELSNSAPTDISISNDAVPETAPPGTTVGVFSTADPDEADSFTYSLVPGVGATDNDFFSITNAELRTAAQLDFESRRTCSIRVRSTDAGGLWIEKTFTINVTDVNEPPARPINIAPADGATGQPVAPTLISSAFADPDLGAEHAASQWHVWTVPEEVLAFDSGEDPVNKTAITIPPGALSYGAAYRWQVRYKDNGGAWSEFSAPTIFTTMAPGIMVMAQQGELLLAWPTNANGFALESTTNLTAPTWTAVSASVFAENGSFKLAVPMTNHQTFFRLRKQ
ncbi:MAG: glycoside hydrolase N-terminal domain-containing protein [Verrucomicrobiae bacterium]|nr:glycoside hydrolase N-terminal domain-containing protein [Verrucomicrobiae bacterium]